jgi:hypothetical protein
VSWLVFGCGGGGRGGCPAVAADDVPPARHLRGGGLVWGAAPSFGAPAAMGRPSP